MVDGCNCIKMLVHLCIYDCLMISVMHNKSYVEFDVLIIITKRKDLSINHQKKIS